MNANRLIGDTTIVERAIHFCVLHMGYFKPNSDAFMLKLKAKDRRSAKEW